LTFLDAIRAISSVSEVFMAMDVCVLIFKGCTSLSAIGPMELLWTAGRMMGPEPFFNVKLVSAATNPLMSPNGLPIHCHATIKEVTKADLVIIPAFDGDILAQLGANGAAAPWVRAMYDGGADVASICTGAFVLAEAGLLDGKTATTHWIAQDLFRSRYPRVRILSEQIVVDHGRVCTSGGATSFLTLTAYLVEKYCGAEAARQMSKVFLIDMNKGPQTAYAIFSTQKNHTDREILEAQEMVEHQGSRELSVVELASRVNMSTRNFIRRFKAATGNTPIEYMQRVRVEAAKHALESGSEPVDSVATRSGYEDVGSFRSVFKRVTGVSPTEYRKRYRFYHA
jgi:transcriptional regulator GlxA family with amidase domain